MIIVKLVVLFCCINGFSAGASDFCEICLNHTLCKYKAQGPGSSCTSYDNSAKLKRQDIKEIINKINERRNFVAMGYSKILPHAANMKKMHWSNELASIAQRWADQCDPAIQPDREDQCRDLENVKVGQNIGSVMGPSPGLSVKGYIEMWFIQVLHYAGSVTYYNKSRDFKANYLTQLLWANTEFVGCGRVKFYVDERNVMLERLVCNFAPKGNTHGKPVYSIGYPGTQCKTGMVPDCQYRGLCGYEDAIHAKPTTAERPVNSLLKVLNLSNDSVKYEIDPIRSNIKLNVVNNNSSNRQRNQKTRHIFANKTYAAFRRIPPLRKQMIGNTFMNISGNNNEYHYQHDRGHSHLYHGHEPPRRNNDMTITINTNQDFRRYDYTTEPMNSYSYTNFRRFNQNVQCTRRMRPNQENCILNQCTTAPTNCCPQTTMCPFTCTEISCTQPVEDHTCFTPYIPPLPDPCACTQPPCPLISTNCNYNTNCPCSEACSTNTCCHTTVCPGLRRQNNDFNDYRRTGMFQYYDMVPNIMVRSGDRKIPPENSSQKGTPFNSDNNKLHKAKYVEKDFDQIHKVEPDYPKYKSQDRDYIYSSFNSGLRKKRQPEDQMPVKPFWQIENFNRQKSLQLKSMRFTTLQNRKTRKNMDSIKWLTSTEPITLRLADYTDYQSEHITEKYLSFNELMHLRKISDGFAHYDLRRTQKAGVKDQKKPAGITTTTKKPAAKDQKANPATNKGTDTSGNTNKKPEPKDHKTSHVADKNAGTSDNTNKNHDTKEHKPSHPTPDKNASGVGNTNTNEETKDHKSSHLTGKNAPISGNINTKEKDEGLKSDSIDTPIVHPFTANTPFIRVNHCTRKLTCTWTAYTVNNDEDGGGGGGPLFPETGSRTPPGYVPECTRTSTCTRDFLDRNKMPTTPSDQDFSESLPEDEEYCERRSLNIQRRSSDTQKPIVRLFRNIDHVNVPTLR